MKKIYNFKVMVIAAIVIFIDQVSKFFINKYMVVGESIPLLKDVLQLTLVLNKGAGFGILQGQRLFFIIISLIILSVIFYKWRRIPSEFNVVFPFGLVLGGLMGNLIDRIFFGFVVDFVDFMVWPVFNVADSAITVGVIWLVISLWKK
jgi:signal peptidase II